MRKQIDRLLRNGIIEPSKSAYSSNAHLVPKKNGQKRMVINFIPLNRLVVPDCYPLPQLQDLFAATRGAKFFCTMDCSEGFFQIPLAKEDRPRTAFLTPLGLFQYTRAPFGLKTSPAAFQRTMNTIFKEGLYTRCVVYMDDFLVFGCTEEQSLSNLEWVFQQCNKYNVKLKFSKCTFFKPEVEFLGYKLGHNFIAPIPNECDPIEEDSPQDGRAVATILGTFNYYSRFVENYTEKTAGLRGLIRNEVPFEWTERHRTSVRELKQELNKSVKQTIPETKSPKGITLRASRGAIETACYENDTRLVCRAGMTLADSQVNYTNVEKHVLALIPAYKKFGPYLGGQVVVKAVCKGL